MKKNCIDKRFYDEYLWARKLAEKENNTCSAIDAYSWAKFMRSYDYKIWEDENK